MPLCDREITDLCVGALIDSEINNAGLVKSLLSTEFTRKPLIEPFVRDSQSTILDHDGNKIKVPSFGLSSFGYDVRIADEFKVFKPANPWEFNEPIDLLSIDDKKDYLEVKSYNGYVDIPAHGFLLTRTEEYFYVPRDILVVCVGKSTYARLGLIVIVTPLEPEWDGHVVIEIFNSNPRPVRIRVGSGIAQFIFHRGNNPMVSYKDRGGKYQSQTNVTTAKL